MKSLKSTWITDHTLDLEYKKYVLLAYLQKVKEAFNGNKLFPFYSELTSRYRELKTLKNDKAALENNFPKELVGLDFETLKLRYRIGNENEILEDVEELMHYALPKMKLLKAEGEEVKKWLLSQMKLDVIGVLPIYKDEGYLFLELDNKNTKDIFRFHKKPYFTASASEELNIKYLYTVNKSRFETHEGLKHQLIKQFKELPNPATFCVSANLHLPVKSSYLPLSQELLRQFLRAA